ncbi:MAG: hypothetical protein V1857_02580 [archaeon]
MSIIPVESKEWEQLTQDVDQLIRNYEKLLNKMRGLEEEKRLLENRLAASESERHELRQRLAPGETTTETNSQEMLTLKELRSTVSRLLKDSETAGNG